MSFGTIELSGVHSEPKGTFQKDGGSHAVYNRMRNGPNMDVKKRTIGYELQDLSDYWI